MPFNPATLTAANAAQDQAAQDASNKVRLIAGPGSGKSQSLGKRVEYLLSTGVPAASIFLLSFTNASVKDLRDKIDQHCLSRGLTSVSDVSVSTIHSLALRLLKSTGNLQRYGAKPMVLDEWELKNFFRAEAAHEMSIPPRRVDDIRQYHDCLWCTGMQAHPLYSPPTPAVTTTEIQSFTSFHGSRSAMYAYVLPGEMVAQCVDLISAGLINPSNYLNIQHLIVDEFQDLNPTDQKFIEQIAQNASVLVCGDDDQSIYSFRYASPTGLQSFGANVAGAGFHQLNHCFRCTTSILAAADRLVNHTAASGRIPKNPISMYANSTPPVSGMVLVRSFSSDREEAEFVAESCKDLIAAGTKADDIFVLLSTRHALLSKLETALTNSGVPFSNADSEKFVDTTIGRFAYCLLRIWSQRIPDVDVVAHRVLTGLLGGVGIGTMTSIAKNAIASSHKYVDLFGATNVVASFPPKCQSAIGRAKAAIANWSGQLPNELQYFDSAIKGALAAEFGASASAQWTNAVSNLPPNTSMEDAKVYLAADNYATRQQIRASIPGVSALTNPAAPPALQILTMHGAKGLSSKVVFVPGLEDQIFPGQHRIGRAGLVLEAARMLYVSITRARAACIMSFANRRTVNGIPNTHAPSRFLQHIGVPASSGGASISSSEVAAIMAEIANL